MDKKGQAINSLMPIIIALIGIAIVLTIGFLVMAEVKDNIIDIQSGDWCSASNTLSGTYTLNKTGTAVICCNSSACPDQPLKFNYTYNVSINLCCNTSSGGNDPNDIINCSAGETTAAYTGLMDCGTGNTTIARTSLAYNGTGDVQNAMADIPGWLPIIVITVIGAILIGLVAMFRRQS